MKRGAQWNLMVCLCAPCSLGHRMAFVHALIDGLTVQEAEPRSKASNEVLTLYKYLVKEMEK